MDSYNEYIDAYSFDRYNYEYEDNYDSDGDKIIYIPSYQIYAYYEDNRFIVYKLEENFTQTDYSNVKEIQIPSAFVQNLQYIYDTENDIKIISKNNKIYFDDIIKN
jgi:hypothetical protein